MKKNIIIIDNFYSNIDPVVRFILTQPFIITGNYPGLRTTSYSNKKLKTNFEKIIGENAKIMHFPIKPYTYNGSFQYIPEKENKNIHITHCVSEWTAILFLSKNAKLNSGIKFLKHNETGIEEITTRTPDNIVNKIHDDIQNNHINHSDKWTMIDYVGNKYNRLVLFRGSRFHKIMNSFGDSKENGMLIQTFYFNVNKNHIIQKTLKYINNPGMQQNLTNTVSKVTHSKENMISNIKLISINPLKWEIPKKIKICMLIFTTSRYEYLLPVLESVHKNLDFDDMEIYKIMIDDYPARRNEETLITLKNKYNIDKLVMNKTNIGYGLSWKKAWSLVPNDVDYIWHQEEDFTYDRRIDIKDLINTFETCPIHLTQLALKRQVWFDSNDHIQKMESGKMGTQINFGDKKVVIHQWYFLGNPSIYPRWVLEQDYEHDPQEHTIVKTLKQIFPQKHSGIYGGALDTPLTRHIGEYTHGKKVIPTQPGYELVKKYDPTKKYYSKNFVREYDK
jgi:hypothetical protein